MADEDQAWRELAAAWQLTLDEGDPCTAAQYQQVQCFRGDGSSLALIRTLDRPGLLTLHGGESGEAQAYALPIGVGDDAATERIGETAHTVPLKALAKVWRGDFATFWRAPPGYARTLQSGQSGPAVDWLVDQLAALEGRAPSPGPHRVDEALKSDVSAFQVAHGLKPDGLAGPTTFMQLNRARGIDEPRLLPPR